MRVGQGKDQVVKWIGDVAECDRVKVGSGTGWVDIGRAGWMQTGSGEKTRFWRM